MSGPAHRPRLPLARGYSEAVAEAVRRDHKEGLSTRDLKEKYRLAFHTVGRMIHRRGAYAADGIEQAE